MSYQFVFEPEAIADLDAMDKTTRQRIFRKINWLALNFEQAAPQGLSANLAGFYKLRVGDYRVMYTINEPEQLISIVRAGNRREVYDL
jgi:mRNA interferase RelE/StbE